MIYAIKIGVSCNWSIIRNLPSPPKKLAFLWFWRKHQHHNIFYLYKIKCDSQRDGPKNFLLYLIVYIQTWTLLKRFISS